MRTSSGWSWYRVCLVGSVGLCLLMTAVLQAEETKEKKKQKDQAAKKKEIKPKAVPEFVNKSLTWLAEAQHSDGGWGAGSHSNQSNRDPHKVKIDPATTAFATMSFMRAGHTPTQGKYKDVVHKALTRLVVMVEESDEKGAFITDIRGTQPQAKLGQMVDTSMTAQLLARVLPTLPKDYSMRNRVDAALDKCVAKLQQSQHQDGSWKLGGGWAPVLQSSLNCSALELAQAAGKTVNQKQLTNARKYQKRNFDVNTGKAAAGEAAGVELYAFSGSQRANAADAAAAQEVIDKAKEEGKLKPDAPVNEENLKVAGVDSDEKARDLSEAVVQAEAQIKRLGDENLLKGFGNNGGEEFLSYMMTSESLVITGGDAWTEWDKKITERMAKIQNKDGSYSGHHCITSPVFCTAAVVQCVLADHDAAILIKISENSLAQAEESKPEKKQ